MTTLYRLYDADGQLLYVGITDNVRARFRSHARTKAWWPQVTERRFERFATWGEAADAEDRAIKTEHPVFNVAGRPGYTPPTIEPAATGDREMVIAARLAVLDEKVAVLSNGDAANTQAREDIKAVALDALRSGAEPGDVYRRVPFTATHMRALARNAGIPAGRPGAKRGAGRRTRVSVQAPHGDTSSPT